MANPSPHLPPHELFHYSALHQILICNSCRYAIQPDAIARHLKEIHRILRDARRPYMDYVEHLHLKDPAHVASPHPHQFPVPRLPVEQGWRCASPGCSYLCVSVKRMENHWPAQHGTKGQPFHDWKPCPLQTFFRGNMLRYFTCQDGKASVSSGNQDIITENASLIRQLQEKYGLDSVDSKLVKHYCSTTYKTFMLQDDTFNIVWQDIVPQTVLAHPFLLHGMLACAALHAAHLDPSISDTMTLRALAHQETALPFFRYALDHPTEQNCSAIICFSFMLTVYTFASDAHCSNDQLFMLADLDSEWADEPCTLPRWLHFLRISCSMLEDVWEVVETSPVAVLACAWEVDDVIAAVGDGKQPYLNFFLSLIPSDSWSPEVVVVYQDAATKLAESFAYIGREDLESKFSTWNILGVWPGRVEDAFLSLLSGRHPAALILLAHYCIILRHLDELWYLEGRSVKLLTSVMNTLDKRWYPCIQEAIRKVMR